MTKEEFETNLGIQLIPKKDLRLMRMVGWFLPAHFMTSYFTTYRLPFGKPIIALPECVDDPMDPRWDHVLEHEQVHVNQQKGAWGLFLSFLGYFFLPLPVFFSGRWFIEREAYFTVDIMKGKLTPEKAANQLWNDYFMPWPKGWMVKWFKKQHEKGQMF